MSTDFTADQNTSITEDDRSHLFESAKVSFNCNQKNIKFFTKNTHLKESAK